MMRTRGIKTVASVPIVSSIPGSYSLGLVEIYSSKPNLIGALEGEGEGENLDETSVGLELCGVARPGGEEVTIHVVR